jgi:NAD(P)-dependent dehydrogenase (short-subunit alcohol dehydrogenase family)
MPELRGFFQTKQIFGEQCEPRLDAPQNVVRRRAGSFFLHPHRNRIAYYACRLPPPRGIKRVLQQDQLLRMSSEAHSTVKKISAFASYPSLRGRVVVVTGGASGIGEHIVEHFAQQGAKVAFLDIQNDAGLQLAHRLGANKDAETHFFPCDLTVIGALQACIETIIDKFKTIDVLVNNAGNDARHKIEDVTPEYWDRSMAVNLRHHFFASQAVIPAMKKAGRGSIINLSSISWIIPSTGLPVYVTAKAAIVGLTRTLAHELGPDNIRVNCVLPGAILTERQKQLWFTDAYKAEILNNQALKRMLSPEEVARLVLFLAADDSSAITSQSYVIDGGWV